MELHASRKGTLTESLLSALITASCTFGPAVFLVSLIHLASTCCINTSWWAVEIGLKQRMDEFAEESLRKVTTGIPGGHKQHVMWLPPPEDPLDPLALIDLTRSIEVR